MTAPELLALRLDAAWLPPSAAWADGLTVKLPAELAERVRRGQLQSQSEAPGNATSTWLRDHRAYLETPTAASRLPVSYRAVPGPLRLAIANAFGRLQRRRSARWAAFPSWPLDLSADLAADLAVSSARKAGPTPVLLTHDIDSPEGLENLVAYFLPIEEACGGRSANYVVPCAWELDHGLLREVHSRGHEIGVHGYDHANKTPFASPDERRKRLDAGRLLGDLYGASGYRAPSLVRTRALMSDLAQRYLYDSSIPTSGGLFPAPNNGCASARPWRIGTLIEIPLSMPRDGTLRFLGHAPREILDLWIECAAVISRSGGIVCLLTHCEEGFSGNPAMLGCYKAFVSHLANDGRYGFVRPSELAQKFAAEGNCE